MGMRSSTCGSEIRYPEAMLGRCAAVDGKNNARALGGDSFDVDIVGPGGANPKAHVRDNNDGCETAPLPCRIWPEHPSLHPVVLP